MPSIGHPAVWAGFLALVAGMLALDLGVFHRRSHVVGFRESLTWSVVWVALSSLFGVGVWWAWGSQAGLEFFTGYVIEKALSVDNLFVMLVLLDGFRVPQQVRHRVLFWGVMGAIVMRAVFIFAGAALLARFHWLMYGFGALLVFTAIRLVLQRHDAGPSTDGRLVRLAKRVLSIHPTADATVFTVVEGGKRFATPLLLAVIAIEGADLVFALDSIPAVFAVTDNAFLIFTSNILALLGLRSLFFLLAGALQRVHLLRYGLAAILAFVGAKMLLVSVWKVPIVVSLGVIVGALAASVVASLLIKPSVTGVTPRAV